MNINIDVINLELARMCMTWKDLSQLSGISTVTLAKINKGFRNPKPITIGKIAKALNVDIEKIIKSEE